MPRRLRRPRGSGPTAPSIVSAVGTASAVALTTVFSFNPIAAAASASGSASVSGASLQPSTVSAVGTSAGIAAVTGIGPSTLTLAAHPRLHFDNARLTAFRSWVSTGGPWNVHWQSYINDVNAWWSVPTSMGSDYPGNDADFFALVWLVGPVSGITLPSGRTYDQWADNAIGRMLAQVAQGPGPTSDLWSNVNHPFHSKDETCGSMARAYDWLFNYAGFSSANKQAVATWLGNLRTLLAMPAEDYNVKSPEEGAGSESHHPMYYAAAFAEDGYADAPAAEMLETFDDLWLKGQYLDEMNYESKGDFGCRVIGSYGSWYPVRAIICLHGWKTATGQNFLTGNTPLMDHKFGPSYVRQAIALGKQHRPGYWIPYGQGPAVHGPALDTFRMFTGVVTGSVAQTAAYVGGTLPTNTSFQYKLQEFLVADPTVTPVEPTYAGNWFSETYGLLAHIRADHTHITMCSPPVSLRGHSWASQGGGPRDSGWPGCTLTVEGTPILVIHKGDYRQTIRGCYGSNIMRFFRPGMTALESDGDTAYTGGWSAKHFQGNSIDTIAPNLRTGDPYPAHDMGGIKPVTWSGTGNSGTAVANNTRWFRNPTDNPTTNLGGPPRQTSYIRTYTWSDTNFHVQDVCAMTVDGVGWSRWYVGPTPTFTGASNPGLGMTDYAAGALPTSITIGPVTWTFTVPAGTTLRVIGPNIRWIDDNWVQKDNANDNDWFVQAGGAAEVGGYQFTFIGPVGPGTQTWEHDFDWS